MKKYIILSWILVLQLSCSSQNDQNEGEIIEVRNFGKFIETDQFDILPFFDKSTYILLDVPEELELYQADKILAGDGLYFIMDAELGNGIFIFEETGNFVAEIPIGGNGPGEIPDLEDLTYNFDTKTLLVLGAYGRKLFEFSTIGEFIRDISLPENRFFNYIAYAGNDLIYLHTLPSPSYAQMKDERMVTALQLSSMEIIAEHLPVPVGLKYNITGEKPLTFQTGKVVFARAFGNRIHIFQKKGNLEKEILLQALAPTNNLYEKETLNQFMDLLADKNELAFADNYLETENLDFLLLVKSGSLTRWGVWDKKNGKFNLANTLFDSNINMPLLPHLEIDDRKVMKLFNDEFFEIYLNEVGHEDYLRKIEEMVPGFRDKTRKFILCIYEN
ncbi:6-bladed beta-propeller [Fontibacter flavus]|uniref:6-bladed beta-propeller n=1 Tax=Fontibacter flavus TaxID=654838 RepID=A0ABV6FT98_9BACT